MAFWFGLMVFGAAQTSSGPLTVDESVKIALSHGFSVLIAQTRVDSSRAQLAEARGMLGPKATLGANYTRFDRQGTSDFNGQQVVTSPIDTKGISATVTLPIDIDGSLRSRANAAKASMKASQQNFVASLNDIKLDARTAFFSVLRSQRLVTVNEQALKDAEAQLKNVQLLEQGGLAAKVDVLRAQTQVQQAKADLTNAHNALALANADFNVVLARPIDASVDLVDVVSLPPEPKNEAALREGAHRTRPEALALLHTRDALANLRHAADAGLKPGLGLSVNYNRNLNTGAFSQPYTLGATLSFSWPIFDSGVTRARVAQARADEAQARIQYDQLLENISKEIRQAMANLENSQERLDLANQQVQYAEENLRLAQLRYQSGEGILLQVTDAETQLTQARSQQVTAKYDYLTAYSQLQRALGTDDLASASNPPDKETDK